MRRLYLLMWHFTRPHRPGGVNVPSWYTDEITRSEFKDYLSYNKRFLEDWRGTLRRWYYTKIVNAWPSKHNQRDVDRIRLQRKRIDDLIDKAVSKNLLLITRITSPNPTSSEIYLKTDWRGREFVKPVQFFKALLEEYDPVVRFTLGGSFGALIVGAVWLYNIL